MKQFGSIHMYFTAISELRYNHFQLLAKLINVCMYAQEREYTFLSFFLIMNQQWCYKFRSFVEIEI